MNAPFNFLLAPRGAAIAVFLLFLLYSPVLKETDIIAAVVVYSFGAYILLLTAATYFFSRRIKDSLTISCFQPESLGHENFEQSTNEEHAAISNIPCIFVMQLNKANIPPGYYLEVQAELQDDGIQPAKHILTGRLGDNFLLKEEIIFPHRGYWTVKKVSCVLCDKLNLTSWAWQHNENIGEKSLLVAPPEFKETALPIISSSSRAGDSLPDLKDKNGDLFDLKAYHPSDGLKKILWKVYAKSGELISRHPEASMTPEGQVIVFALAGKLDEEVCSSVLAYLKATENLNLELFFSCLGAGEHEVTSTRSDTKMLLIDTVWKASSAGGNGALQSLRNLIERFNQAGKVSRIDRIAIFCSKKFLASEEGPACAAALGDFLESQSIKPFLCVIRSYLNERNEASPRLLERLFLSRDSGDNQLNEQRYYEFLSVCKTKNWEYAEEAI